MTITQKSAKMNIFNHCVELKNENATPIKKSSKSTRATCTSDAREVKTVSKISGFLPSISEEKMSLNQVNERGNKGGAKCFTFLQKAPLRLYLSVNCFCTFFLNSLALWATLAKALQCAK